jgi:hypothetical protein
MRLIKLALLTIMIVPPLAAQKFYPDDPLQSEPRPRDAAGVKLRKLNDYYDLVENSFSDKGKPDKKTGPVPAQGVNTIGEPMDGAWYVHRHYWKSMSNEDLARGPGGEKQPSPDGPWTVVSAKTEGITPGFVMTDSKGDRYFVKFDPIDNPELATGAEMISTQIFYALGYHVPECYLIHFTRERLILGPDVTFTDAEGRKRKMTGHDLDKLLTKAPKNSNGGYRAIASLQLPGKPLGGFKYFGTRPADPNDVVPHQNRRELRGLYVFAGWLNHNDSRSINTFDSLINEGSSHYVRHYLMDFGSTLGSSSTSVKKARVGGEYYLDFKPAPKQIATLGFAVPYWAKARYPGYPSVGGFESSTFKPDKWVPDYPNAAFLNRLPDDEFWAAKQVMAFTDDQIRAIVKVAQYSDPQAERYVADTLIARRDKIGRTFFARVLPLDRFEVKQGELVFHDLAQEHDQEVKGELQVAWSSFDNQTQKTTPISPDSGFKLPKESLDGSAPSYFAANIWRGDDKARAVTVYLRTTGGQVDVVGIDRTWRIDSPEEAARQRHQSAAVPRTIDAQK